MCRKFFFLSRKMPNFMVFFKENFDEDFGFEKVRFPSLVELRMQQLK